MDRYLIFDDGSTDGSLGILAAHPRVEVRQFPRTSAGSFVLSELALFNNCWKESRGKDGREAADWVIICSLDEHLCHPTLPAYLADCVAQGVTVIPALGFQMFTEDFPGAEETLCQSQPWGVPDHYDCKLIMFSPTAIDEINYEPGGHVAAPVGRVLAPARDELVLRHYQLLGIGYTADRFRELAARLGSVDREKSWGSHYSQSVDDLTALWAEYRRMAVDTSVWPPPNYGVPDWWKDLPRP